MRARLDGYTLVYIFEWNRVPGKARVAVIFVLPIRLLLLVNSIDSETEAQKCNFSGLARSLD
jgi:hypothetical protein